MMFIIISRVDFMSIRAYMFHLFLLEIITRRLSINYAEED